MIAGITLRSEQHIFNHCHSFDYFCSLKSANETQMRDLVWVQFIYPNSTIENFTAIDFGRARNQIE